MELITCGDIRQTSKKPPSVQTWNAAQIVVIGGGNCHHQCSIVTGVVDQEEPLLINIGLLEEEVLA